MLRIVTLALLATTLPASADVPTPTLQELAGGGMLEIQSENEPCPEWAKDYRNQQPQKYDTYEGQKTFYWDNDWAGEHLFRRYQTLDDEQLLVKIIEATGECSVTVFKFKS